MLLGRSVNAMTHRGLLTQHASIHHSKFALAQGAALVKVGALEPAATAAQQQTQGLFINGCTDCS
jgi:hypothetical protein